MRNENGLTLSDFLAAVGAYPEADRSLLRAAWESGDDPSDWKEHYSTARNRARESERLDRGE